MMNQQSEVKSEMQNEVNETNYMFVVYYDSDEKFMYVMAENEKQAIEKANRKVFLPYGVSKIVRLGDIMSFKGI